jgi:hypothetical protein
MRTMVNHPAAPAPVAAVVMRMKTMTVRHAPVAAAPVPVAVAVMRMKMRTVLHVLAAAPAPVAAVVMRMKMRIVRHVIAAAPVPAVAAVMRMKMRAALHALAVAPAPVAVAVMRMKMMTVHRAIAAAPAPVAVAVTKTMMKMSARPPAGVGIATKADHRPAAVAPQAMVPRGIKGRAAGLATLKAILRPLAVAGKIAVNLHNHVFLFQRALSGPLNLYFKKKDTKYIANNLYLYGSLVFISSFISS